MYILLSLGVKKMTKQENDNILEWLKTTRIPLTEISKKSGLSRSTLYNWLEGGEIRRRNREKILSIYEDEIELINVDVRLKGEVEMNNAIQLEAKEELLQKNKLIHYQEKEIDVLKRQLEKSEAQNEIIKIDNQYDTCNPDFQTVVQMRNVFSLKTIERCIVSVDNMNPFADALEVDKEEMSKKYYQFGKWYKNNDHPIDKLVDNESLQKLKSATSGIPKQAKLFKFTFGAFYLKFHILYIYNYNFCMTRCYCKVNWATNPIIETKNEILHKGKLKDLDRGN